VSTLGELLELPEIAVPSDWPPAMAKLVAMELREMMSMLGVEYAGQIRVPETPSADLVAEGLRDLILGFGTGDIWFQALEPSEPPERRLRCRGHGPLLQNYPTQF
jgi:hypothetical protein